MDETKRQLTERLIALLERMFAQMRPGPTEWWPDLELTLPQFRTLRLLGQGPQRMSDIAAFLGVSMSSATSMIDRLVNKGVVERAHDPADRRVVTCRLTPLGSEHVDRFWRMGRRKAEALAEALTPQDLETVVRAMEIISAALAEVGHPPLQSPGSVDDARQPEATER